MIAKICSQEQSLKSGVGNLNLAEGLCETCLTHFLIMQRGCFEGQSWFGRKRPLAATRLNCLERPLAATRFEFSRAATCSHLLGIGSNGHSPPLTVTGSHLRPLAATRAAASGCHALALGAPCRQEPAATCGHLQPLAPIAPCGHLRPLEWLHVAANGRKGFWSKWKQSVTGGCGLERPLAATCLELAGAATCGHCLKRPLAATCGHSSGCKWLQPCTCFRGLTRPLAAAATCSQSSGCKWLQMAASGGGWLHAGRNTWQSWHLEKTVSLERRCFKLGGWIGSISSCLALTPDTQNYAANHDHPCLP